MSTGSLSLADVAERSDTLSVACTRCERSDRYPLATLIERHGPTFDVPSLLRLVSADCPKRQAAGWYERCDPYCVGLAGLFGVAR